MNCSFCANAGAAVAKAPKSAASATPACFPVIVLPFIDIPPSAGRPGLCEPAGHFGVVPPSTRRTGRGGPTGHVGVVPRFWPRVCPRIVAASIRERPQPELLLGDGPQPGQAVRLGN